MTEPDAANYRVSDAEREHVVGLLSKATGRGLLDLDEFSSRTGSALAARTRAELNRLVVDLPGLVHRDHPPVPEDRVELWEDGSPIRVDGAWRVPGTLVLRPMVRTCRIDLTDAEFTHPVTRVELHGGAVHVRLRLPAGATVDHRDLVTKRGKPSAVRDKGGFGGSGGNPHLVLTGVAMSGTVVLER